MNQGYTNDVGDTGGEIGHSIFEQIISLENLFLAWREFRRGKRDKRDVQLFEFNLENNLFQIHQELLAGIYQNDPYISFCITDPKLRRIHKASIRDRVVHQAIFRILYHLFDKNFIYDSYSCRLGKGTHKAVDRLGLFLRQISGNYREKIYALKCDIKKFFDAVDQDILLALIQERINNKRIIWLINKIVKSFSTSFHKGLPLGNVTSQLFSNIYLDRLDQFVKYKLCIKYYLRYCDDFMILSGDYEYLKSLIPKLVGFLDEALKLQLHKQKIIIRKFSQGVDFLGYVSLPHYRVLRTKTKRRIIRRVQKHYGEVKRGCLTFGFFHQSWQSYLGVLKHCCGFKIKQQLGCIYA